MAKETLLLQASNSDIQTINGVTYFKLTPGFSGDTTKNCGLTGEEVDKNFYFLRGYDIESVELDEQNNLIITRIDKNYDPIVINLGGEDGNPTFELDRNTGTLIVTYPDGTVANVEGFLTDISNATVFTDETLIGTGKQSNKLGISPVEKTGTYSPVEKLIDIIAGDSMPNTNNCGVGYRVVTKEKIDIYGCLYPYSAIEQLSTMLEGTGWRVPTKDDWDEMLNAFECSGDCRSHSENVPGPYGCYAGTALKSSGTLESEDGLWKTPTSPDAIGNNTSDLSIYPVGGGGSRNVYLGDDDDDIEGFDGKMGYYWTSTEGANGQVFVKVFSYNIGGVSQELISKSNYAAIRLVKDYNYEQINNVANILGENYPIKLVNGIYEDYQYAKLWTKINLFNDDQELNGIHSRLEGSYPNAYYISEWNGQEWVKKPMNEGDTVVIKDDNYTEYMLVDGVLISVVNDMKGDIIHTNDEIEEIRRAIGDIRSDINNIDETINEFSETMDKLEGEDIKGDTYTLGRSSEMVLLRKNNNDDIKLKISDDFFDFGEITR